MTTHAPGKDILRPHAVVTPVLLVGAASAGGSALLYALPEAIGGDEHGIGGSFLRLIAMCVAVAALPLLLYVTTRAILRYGGVYRPQRIALVTAVAGLVAAYATGYTSLLSAVLIGGVCAVCTGVQLGMLRIT